MASRSSAWSDKSVFTFKQFLNQAGGQLFNDSNEPTFVENNVERVLEFFDQLSMEHLPEHVQVCSTSKAAWLRTSAC